MLLTDIVLNYDSGLGLPMLVSAELNLASLGTYCVVLRILLVTT